MNVHVIIVSIRVLTKKQQNYFCNEESNSINNKLRLIALIDQNTIVDLFNLTLSIREDERERFRMNYKIELNKNNTVRQMDIYQVILSGGVLVENTRAIRFFEKNNLKFSTTFYSHDGYECKDGLIDIDLFS